MKRTIIIATLWILGGIIILIFIFISGVLFEKHNSTLSRNDTPTFVIPTLPVVQSKEAPYPAGILNLTNWKITMPFGSEKRPTHPLEIRQPDLATYKVEPWFTLTPDGKGVAFRASVTGPTTGGTKYARSELREMTDNGKTPASWSSTQGIHTMFIDEAITHAPKVKKHVVAGQIHDDGDDIIVIRLEQPNLYVHVDGKNVYTLDKNYTLGKRFTLKFVVSGGKTNVYYNGSSKPAYTLTQDYDNSYFKAGAYTQSSCEREGKQELCNADNYGEVVIYQLEVTHQ